MYTINRNKPITNILKLNIMKSINCFKAFIVLFLLVSCSEKNKEAEQEIDSRPNVLLIVADDLGYSDITPFGGNINTPILNQLSMEGRLFSNFHVLPTCSPTRSALISGNDNHTAGMGVMAEFIYPPIEDLPGYVGHLNDQIATIPEILNSNGYHTYMTGKWHLGEDDSQSPFTKGFEETFTMMNGGGSHWADQNPLSPPQKMIYRKNGNRIESLPEDFYSTKNYTDSLITFIDRNRDSGKPFFGYLSYTAPHDPLHAPAEYISKYKGMFDEGWDQLRMQRLESLKEKELVPSDINEFPKNRMIPLWDELTEEQKELFSRDMEVYAAMIDYMDMSIGRLFSYLKSQGLYENTLIIFFSDNGANGAPLTAYPGNQDGEYLASFDNTYDNRGLPNSFVDMGAGWAQASSSPFKYYKSFTSEGGIKSPLIVKLPGKVSNPGSWNHSLTHVTDIMPTILDVSKSQYPEQKNGITLKQPIGNSILPLITGEQQHIHDEYGFGYELFEMRAYFKNEWKILRLPVPFGSGEWELYNIKTDPGELSNLADQHPDKLNELISLYDQYVQKHEVFDHEGYFDELYRQAYGAE